MPGLHVAFKAPPLPAYYTPDEGKTEMDLSVQIDRGDIWYDVPFDARGKPIVQRRDHYPHLTLFVNWHGQKIPLVQVADDDRVVAQRDARRRPRLHEVQELRHRAARVEADRRDAGLDSARRDAGEGSAEDEGAGSQGRAGHLVNTDVMGPGYQSAYGLVMGIHIDPKRGGFDNQIRTHGSVDYTSIARRFSHGCHRLVNNRAVRLFDFVLHHRRFRRIGDVPLNLKKRFEVEGETYRYALTTRGYYYELGEPDPDRRPRRARHGRGEEADHRLRAQAGRRLQRRSGRGRRGGVDGDHGARARTGARPLTRTAAVAFALAAAFASRLAAAAPDYAAATVVRATASGPATDLDVTLDPDGRRISGHARLRIVNDGAAPLSTVSFILYPNALAQRSPALNDVRFHWLYPGGFSPAAIDADEPPHRRRARAGHDRRPSVRRAAGDRQRAARQAARAR